MWLVLLASVLLGALAGDASAADLQMCFADAGARYGIAPPLLEAMGRTESRLDPLAVHRNPDGTADIGLMQINSRWLGPLARYGIEERDLRDPCVSIEVGAWVLAGNIRRYGYGWQAVGAYNAGTGQDAATEERRHEYALRVYRRLRPEAALRLRESAEDE